VEPQNAKLANRLQRYAGEKTRLKIPFLFNCEAPHGFTGTGGTIFPQTIAMAATFNKNLARRMGETIGAEARSVGINVAKGPVLDIALDPRWGRVEETFGEDTYLTGRMSVEIVKGMQGKSFDTDRNVVSMLKHFTAHGGTEGGHNCSPAHTGERELREVALPPFEAAIMEGGALSVMTAYNEIDGVLCTANPWLLTDVLRGEMGFEGFVQSDASAIYQVYTRHCAITEADAVRQCVEAGMDIQNYDFSCGKYEDILLSLIREGKLAEACINRAVSNILRVKFLLGLFENPYINEFKAGETLGCKKHKEYAIQAARESVCLLKNEEHLLPLNKNIKSVAVIGPNADQEIAGSYVSPDDSGVAKIHVESLLESVKRTVSPDTRVYYAEGCKLTENKVGRADIISAHSAASEKLQAGIKEKSTDDMIKEACEIAKKSEAVILVLGEQPWLLSSEGFDRADIGLPGRQEELVKAVYNTGVPVVVMLYNGRPLSIPWLSEHIPAVVTAWYPGQAGGAAAAEVLFGDYNPAGRLPVSFPKSSAQLPVYYNYKYGTRPDYLDLLAAPLYRFGHGLSYSTFEYRNLIISPETTNIPDPAVNVSVDVENTGSRDGDEVVQLYVSDLAASVTPRVKTLKGFERIHLKAGETKTVSFALTEEELAVIGLDCHKRVEPGEFEVLIGGNSDEGLKGRFTVFPNVLKVQL
jgi:beta-glucosidase